MSKKRVIVIIIAVMIILGSIICFNFGRIVRYFQNKEWEIADSVASVSINNYMTSESTLENVIVIGNNYVQSYSKEGKEKLDLFISYQGVVSCSAGDYCVIGEKNGTNVCLIMGSQKQWENTINGSLYDVYVNKNGYVALIYKQSGYKSLIKVLSPDGNELFTSYFASTYAVDVAITNDNKMLAIAEVDTEGIHIVSSIKLIDMNHLGNENLQKIELEDNCLVVDIAYNDKNDLLIRTDASMEYIRNGIMNKLCDFNYGNTLYATIENHTNAILVTKEENGLFDVKYQ